MTLKRPFIVALAMLALLLIAQPAAAHRIRLWATVMESGTIRGEVFSPGARLAGVTVEIFDGSGTTRLATVTTDAAGQFQYHPLARHDHLLKVDLGDGHFSQTLIPADSLTMIDDTPADGSPLPSAPQLPTNASTPPQGSAPPAPLDASQYEERLFDLRRQLEAERERIRLRDVFAGVGYIVGAAGLAAFFKQRRSRRTHSGADSANH